MTAGTAALQSQVLDSLQTLTIFAAFVTVLFGIRYPCISAGLKGDLPRSALTQERKHAKDELRRLLLSQCIPLTALNIIPAYLFLPLSLNIMESNNFSAWNFDTVETGFVFLALYLIIFFCWSAYLSTRLAIKAYSKLLISQYHTATIVASSVMRLS